MKYLLAVSKNLAHPCTRFTMMVTIVVCSGGRSVVTPPLYVPKLLGSVRIHTLWRKFG